VQKAHAESAAENTKGLAEVKTSAAGAKAEVESAGEKRGEVKKRGWQQTPARKIASSCKEFTSSYLVVC
jgi:hypothetical protein